MHKLRKIEQKDLPPNCNSSSSIYLFIYLSLIVSQSLFSMFPAAAVTQSLIEQSLSHKFTAGKDT